MRRSLSRPKAHTNGRSGHSTWRRTTRAGAHFAPGRRMLPGTCNPRFRDGTGSVTETTPSRSRTLTCADAAMFYVALARGRERGAEANETRALTRMSWFASQWTSKSLAGLREDDGDSPDTQHHSEGGEEEASARLEWCVVAACTRLLDPLLSDVRVGDEEQPHHRERHADRLEGPSGSGRQFRDERASRNADCEGCEARPPPGQVGALVREAGPPRRVARLVNTRLSHIRRFGRLSWFPARVVECLGART